MIKSQLVDARNWSELKDTLIDEIRNHSIIGFDIETEDHDRHEGLNLFMKVDDDGHKSTAKKLVFDVNRTTVTGFSWYCDGSKTAYYLNLAHADVENRIPWSEARQLLEAKPADAHWIAHNGAFEITMMMKSLGFHLDNVICTLQMAVSAFNEDQYPKDKLAGLGFGEMTRLFASIAKEFHHMDPSGDLTERQADLLGKIVGKTSKSSFSYNGMVDSIKYGYGLKALTKSLFNYEQATFLETLDGNAHMGQLTGEQVVDYGAEDAYWAVRIFHRLLPMLASQGDQLIQTFFEQENPMIYVYSSIWQEGMKINLEQVHKRRQEERLNYVNEVRKLHSIVRSMLPFPAKPNPWLMNEEWYSKSEGKNHRSRIEAWAKKDLPEDPFKCVHTTAGAVSTAWAEEQGLRKSPGPNFTHYMMMRTLMYDLPEAKPIYSDGKVASDKDARAKIKHNRDLIDCINELAGIEQRMKLYLTPYTLLCDPETQRMYPVVSSELNTRRMAASLPNPMQLAKRGESTYVRGFFEADEEDHVVVSIDWSQVELVLIGDFSNDEGFADAYGQLPFKDLHTKAVGEMFGTDDPKSLPDFKKLRTEVGKGANFNYWYSGALSTVGARMGWSSDKMWEMTQKYRDTFPDAEEWRVNLIGEARENGYVTLPDGHRRVKFEATYDWQGYWRHMWQATESQGLINFGELFIKKLTNRAGNQIVNAMIQGSCATLAKRSILRINKRIKELGLRARFMIPIHDELVFSVHKDDVIAFLHMAKPAMCEHPDIVRRLKLDATASIGRNFEPYHPEKAPYGQIEIDESPLIEGYIDVKDARLNDEQIQNVLNYLFQEEPCFSNAA